MGNNDAKFERVEIHNVTLKRSSDKAGLYVLENGDEHWLPFSQISEDSVDKDGETGTVRIPRWLAEERDLEYEEE